MRATVWCDKKGSVLFRYMCDKLGEKTETHFKGCRVGKSGGGREAEMEGKRERKSGILRVEK
ncbi:hypothetical protein [Prevotella falsenii]|uniref:hypothetical protein n=1 Tax=Prevotella falsenii TaxID=515414 RepID=UPI000468428F|nr:hypothetical protein [Prevotella falsenii]